MAPAAICKGNNMQKCKPITPKALTNTGYNGPVLHHFATAPHGCGCPCGKCYVARPWCPDYVAATPAMRVAKRLAPLVRCTPRQLLHAMYYVPRWVPHPVAQFYLHHVAQRFYPAGYLCQ